MREKYKKHPHNQYFLVRGACFYHEKVRILNYKGVRTKVLCYFEFYRTAIIANYILFYSFAAEYKFRDMISTKDLVEILEGYVDNQ